MEKVPVRESAFSSSNGSSPLAHWAAGSQDIDSPGLRVALPVALAAICLVGFAGNGLVAAVLIRGARRGKSSLINSLILNVSLADLLLVSVCGPLRAAALATPAWTLGWFVCKSADCFLHSCLAAKSLTAAALAKACFMYVSRQPCKAVQVQQRRVAALLLSIWALALALPLPQWPAASLLRGQGGRLLCVSQRPGRPASFLGLFARLYPALVYCAPLLAAFLYHWRALRCCSRQLRSQARGRRLTLMLLASSLAFAALCAPEWVVWLWARLWGPPPPPAALALLSQLLLFSLSSAQPLIFVALSEEFKEGFLGLCKRLVVAQPQAPEAPPPSQRRQSCTQGAVPASPPARHEKSVQVPELEPAPAKLESPASKTANLVLTDMEQFWHDRQNAPATAQEDPIPWEHQDQLEVSACPEASAKM
ncbi:G-protein coupled receptor 151-like [Scyliorhinus torazame]|uniref:G-protein coupled receptors family 1 profile domain-containing protein n=1 Tax=Scyliorhinus torazame TaxID=75743 RepID=A0A401NHM8_SCYTO|nr:hypothetical protein [Scyliorhinus torazame]